MAFFYNWTDDQIRSLDIDSFDQYWRAIECIEAQNILKLFDVSAWPTMKKSSKEKLHKQLFKIAYPASVNEVKQVSNAELAKFLSGGV